MRHKFKKIHCPSSSWFKFHISIFENYIKIKNRWGPERARRSLCWLSKESLQFACLSPGTLDSLEGHGCFPDTPAICGYVEMISKHVFVLSFLPDSHCQGPLNYGCSRVREGTRRWPGHHSSRNRAGWVRSAVSPTRGSVASLCTTHKHLSGPPVLVCSKCLLTLHLLRNTTYQLPNNSST